MLLPQVIADLSHLKKMQRIRLCGDADRGIQEAWLVSLLWHLPVEWTEGPRPTSCLLRTLSALYLTRGGLALLASPVFPMGTYIPKPPAKAEMGKAEYLSAMTLNWGASPTSAARVLWQVGVQAKQAGLLLSSTFSLLESSYLSPTTEVWNINKLFFPTEDC